MSSVSTSKTPVVPALMRLNPSTLDGVGKAVVKPEYDPSSHGTGIVHVGVGAFHRAHQAVYTDKVLAKHGGDWRITGVSLRSSTAAEQLNPQGGLYTVVSKDDRSCEYHVVGAIDRVIAPDDGSNGALESMAAAGTKIVSLTITEKGYCLDSSTAHLAEKHPDIVADLNTPRNPGTAVGCIVEALRRRRDSGLGPFTVMSCDNLSSNGAAVRQAVIEYSELLDGKLSAWIERNTSFPSTMVDRICPATTRADRETAVEVLGLDDHGLVVTEPFSQWVIEDNFCSARPRWEEAGAEIVSDVTPWETAKLRLLNGSHSAMAYIGCLEGYQYMHEVIGDHTFESFVRDLMHIELVPTLQVPGGLDVVEYQKKLLARFHNPALAHQTVQVAMDGSQKLPQRLIAPAIDLLDAGQSINMISIAIAMWIRYVTSEDAHGKRRNIDDPLKERLAKLPSSSSHSASKVIDAVLDLSEIFDSRAARNAHFRNSLIMSLESIIRHGVRGTIKNRSRSGRRNTNSGKNKT